MGQVSKLPYLGMKLAKWRKFHVHILSFYPIKVEIELIFGLRATVSEIWSDFQN